MLHITCCILTCILHVHNYNVALLVGLSRGSILRVNTKVLCLRSAVNLNRPYKLLISPE